MDMFAEQLFGRTGLEWELLGVGLGIFAVFFVGLILIWKWIAFLHSINTKTTKKVR
jgi:hypothetical protein